MISIVLATLVLGIVFLPVVASAKTTKIMFWDLFAGGDKQYMDSLTDRFNASQSEISVEKSTVTWTNYYDRLITAALAGMGPDVAIAHITSIPVIASILHPLDKLAPHYGLTESDFFPVCWNGSHYEGTLIAIPLDVHAEILYYNIDILEQVGLVDADGQPILPRGKDELIKAAQAIQAATGKIGFLYPQVGAVGPWPYWNWVTTLYQNGGNLLTPDNKKAAFNTKAGVEALEFWVDGIYKDKICPSAVVAPEHQTLFLQGKAGMLVEGVWAVGNFERTAGLNFGVTLFPQIFGDEPAFWGNSHALILTGKPEKIDAAMTFVAWLTENSADWSEAGHIPARVQARTSETFLNKKYRPGYAPGMKYVRYSPIIKGILEIETILLDEVEAALSKSKTAEQALADAEKRANKALAKWAQE